MSPPVSRLPQRLPRRILRQVRQVAVWPMDIITGKAWLSVARGCGFGCLAILCMMVGLSMNIPLAFTCGGAALLLMSLILILKKRYLAAISHRRTELWIMLTPKERPDERIARQIISAVLGRTYLEFALLAAKAAAVLLALSLGFHWIGGR